MLTSIFKSKNNQTKVSEETFSDTVTKMNDVFYKEVSMNVYMYLDIYLYRVFTGTPITSDGQ